jgi:hypothetical protein
MSPSEMIQDLLDGELDPHHELTLFGELAVNTDLRTEFKQQLAIRHTVQNDRMALVPPAHLTNAVFSNLGFAAPLAGAATGVAGGGLLLQWLSRFGLPLVAAAAAVGITSTTMSSDALSGSKQPESAVATTEAPIIEQPIVPSNQAADSQLADNINPPQTDDKLIALRSENARLRSRLEQLEMIASSSNGNQSGTATDNAGVTQEQDAAPTPTVAVTSVLPTSAIIETSATISTLDQTAPFEVQKLDVVPQPWEQYPSFIVQVRGVAAQGLTEVSVQPQTTWYDDASIALLYQLSDRHTFGVEVGNESFPQVFEGMRNGRVIRYEQQPAAQWAGLVYRYSFTPIADRFVPFVQGFAGGSTFGPLGRLAGGIQYSPAGPLTFLVGVEGSLLGYQFQNTWFTSSKLGFTYGVAVRL